jgi:hypothetical protein
MMYGDGSEGPNPGNLYAAQSASSIFTWTKPARWPTVIGITVYYVDFNRLSGTQSGNWSWRFNSTGSYQAMGQTIARDNKMAKFYVSNGGSAITSFQMRAATAAGTAVAIFPVGIEAWFHDPLTTSGVIVNNLARNGYPLNYLIGKTTAGDRMAYWDLCKIDPVNGGGAVSHAPTLGSIVMHGNDIRIFNDTTKWDSNLRSFASRAAGGGAPVFFMSHFELSQFDEPNAVSPGYPRTNQENYRNQMQTTATAIGVPHLNLYDELKKAGFGTDLTLANCQNVALRAVNWCNPNDNGHPMQLGHIDIAKRVFTWLKPQLFPTLAANDLTYLTSAASASRAANGTVATQAVSAAVPYSVYDH